MLAKRIIPTMLVRGRTLVKGERYDGWRSIGHAAQAARVHAMRGVDELMILDIAATAENRGPDLAMVRELSEACFIPITVGGGVRTLAHIDALLRAGADKVAICTAAFEVPSLVSESAQRFGNQAIVGVVEYGDKVTTRCGRDEHEGTPLEWACWLVHEGCGEIVLSSTDRDGTQEGYDIDLIRQVSAAISVPLVASGGCSGYSDMLAAFKAGADACAAGALFAYTDSTPNGAARFLRERGVEMRT